MPPISGFISMVSGEIASTRKRLGRKLDCFSESHLELMRWYSSTRSSTSREKGTRNSYIDYYGEAEILSFFEKVNNFHVYVAFERISGG